MTALEIGYLWKDIYLVANQCVDIMPQYLVQIFVMIMLRDASILGLFFIMRTNRHYAKALKKERHARIKESSLFYINPVKGSVVQVMVGDVVYIHHKKNYSYFFLSDGKSLCQYISLFKIEENLPKDTFVRINKSTIVNRKHIESIDEDNLLITTTLPDSHAGGHVVLALSPKYLNGCRDLLV